MKLQYWGITHAPQILNKMHRTSAQTKAEFVAPWLYKPKEKDNLYLGGDRNRGCHGDNGNRMEFSINNGDKAPGCVMYGAMNVSMDHVGFGWYFISDHKDGPLHDPKNVSAMGWNPTRR